MTLRERLAERVAAETAEIARIQADATANLAAARKRLAILAQAQAVLTPEMEALIEALATTGVRIVE